MKTKKVIIAAAMLMAVSTQGKADEWHSNSIYAQYNSSKLTNWDYDGIKFNGLTVGYNKAFSITRKLPLFVEAGAAFSALWSKSTSNYTQKLDLYSVKVPVSFVYKWDVTNGIAVLPYAGIYARYNVYGEAKFAVYQRVIGSEISGGVTKEYDYVRKISYEVKPFDENDMKSIDLKALKRFQMGWQVGANIRFGRVFYAGLSYGSDFSNIGDDYDGCKLNAISINAGFNF